MNKSAKILLIIGIIIIPFMIAMLVFTMQIMFEDEKDQKRMGVRHNINDCIEEVSENSHKEYSEIAELVCDPGPDNAFDGEKYDLLNKLTNLESITIVGIADDKTAQLFFEELTKLKKLSSVEIKDSNVNSFGKLAEIKNLSNLSISTEYEIYDVNLLGTKGSFKNLKSLKLVNAKTEKLPDLTALTNLKSLAISGFSFAKLDYESVNWENLIDLDIQSTNITSIDDKIIKNLYNLESLNISHTKINKIQFVLKLPKLKSFSYYHIREFLVDMEPLKKHSNFNSSWLDNI